jgi:microsomal epoxide hydrolase
MTPEPFTLHVPDEVLDDLRVRLEPTRWPDELPARYWYPGVPDRR